MDRVNSVLALINDIIWHDYMLFGIVGVGVLFTVWSGFGQFRALTHGVAVVAGKYDDANDPGAISHFQALSAALSATVGLGNIGGVALAIGLGGPGAIFWMWVIGFIGMAIKLTEVTLSMLYRNTDDPDNPHGGPMWVAARATKRLRPDLAGLGGAIGTVFCVMLLVSTATGGNMFQAWNVGNLTQQYFGVPSIATGVVLAVIVGLVIIGGIKRIGRVAGTLVPLMVVLYLAAGAYVLFVHAAEIPSMFALIFRSAFAPTEASGAFIGGTAGFAFLIGMKRAIFSNEAGQGSSPIAHCAARTDEPAREGIVAGLEPFIDTIVVCTFTALIILSTGVWDRGAEARYQVPPHFVPVEGGRWSLEEKLVPPRQKGEWQVGVNVFMIYEGNINEDSGNKLHRIDGVVVENGTGQRVVTFADIDSDARPTVSDAGLYGTYVAASLTALAFDSVSDGLGKWLVTLATWLFALSTMISWSYYGEQCMVYLAGERSVLGYKLVYCLLIIVATMGFIKTDTELDNFIGFGTGVILLANIPITLVFGYQAMRAYKNYVRRLKAGQLTGDEPAPSVEEILADRTR